MSNKNYKIKSFLFSILKYKYSLYIFSINIKSFYFKKPNIKSKKKYDKIFIIHIKCAKFSNFNIILC